MRKFSKLSSLILAISTATFAGGFFVNNIENISEKIIVDDLITMRDSKIIPSNQSDKYHMSINNINVNRDMTISLLYSVYNKQGGPLTQSEFNSDVYGVELYITDNATDEPIEIISIPNESFIPSDNGPTFNSPYIELTNSLYSLDKTYDMYIRWHEYSSSEMYSSSAASFTTPVSQLPEISISTMYAGATQSIVSFRVDYFDNSGLFVPYDPSQFFDDLTFSVGPELNDLTTINGLGTFDSGDHNNGNAWLEWEKPDLYGNASFTYNILVDDLLSTNGGYAIYNYKYNNDNFLTNENVTNKDDPYRINLGGKELNLPTVEVNTRVPDLPHDTPFDYETVYLDYIINPNEKWEMLYNYSEIESSMDPDAFKLFELTSGVTYYNEDDPIVQITDITSVDGTHSVADITHNPSSTYGSVNTITITGLQPGTDYTAEFNLAINSDVFGIDEIPVSVEFSTLDTIEQPSLKFVDQVDLDNSTSSNWKRAELEFLFTSPSSWAFGDLLLPGEVFSSGKITFAEVGASKPEVIEGNISNELLNTLNEGTNILNTDSLDLIELTDPENSSCDLKSNSTYDFELELEYSELAKRLFNADSYPKVTGRIDTKSYVSIPYPKVNPIGTDVKTQYIIEVAIPKMPDFVDGEPGKENYPATLHNTFEKLYIKEITDTSVEPNASLDIEDKNYVISSIDLVDDANGMNNFLIEDLIPEHSYAVEVALKFNDLAIDERYGWIKHDDPRINEEGEIVVSTSFSTLAKYDAFEITSTVKSPPAEGDGGLWNTSYEISAPKGNDIIPGMDTPGAFETNKRLYYQLFDITNGSSEEVIEKTTLDVSEATETLDSYVWTVDLDDLNPASQYMLIVGSDVNEEVMMPVANNQANFGTGKSIGMDNSMLEATWTYEDEDPEINNRYEDVFVNVTLKNPLSNSFSNGYESITLYNPVGNPIANSNEPLAVDNPIQMKLDDYALPGEELSGYKLKVNNASDYTDSGVMMDVGSSTLPYLKKTEVVNYSENQVQSTFIDVTFELENFNNILSATLILKDDLGNVVDSTTLDVSEDPANPTSGSKKFENCIFTNLNPEQGYNLFLDIQYKNNIVGPGFVEETIKLNSSIIETPAKDKAEFKIYENELESFKDSVSIPFNWKYNDSNRIMIDNVEFRLDSSFGGYGDSSVYDKVVTYPITSATGGESGVFDDLNSSTEYKMYWIVNFDDGSSEEGFTTFSTQSKSNDSVYDFELRQESENGIALDYTYINPNAVEDPDKFAVTDITYELDGPSMSAPMTLSMDLSTTITGNSVEEGTIVFEDNSIINPGNLYTVKQTVKYDEHSAFVGPGSTDEEFVTETTTKQIDIKFDPSIFDITPNLVDASTLQIEIGVDSPNEFMTTGNKLSLSLFANKEMLPFVFNGVTYKSGVANLSYLDLKDYKVEAASTDTYHLYRINLQGLYVPLNSKIDINCLYDGTVVPSESIEQSNDSFVNPNSLTAVNRYESGYGNYIYELEVESNGSLDLQEGIEFTKRNSTDISIDIDTLNKTEILNEGLELNEEHIYIKVSDSIINKDDWRDISFLDWRMIMTDDSTSSPAYHLIQSTDMIEIENSIESSIELINKGNSINIELMVYDPNLFSNPSARDLTVSLLSGGKRLPFYYEDKIYNLGIGSQGDAEHISLNDLQAGYVSEESSKGVYQKYEFRFDGIYIPNGEDVKLNIIYNGINYGPDEVKNENEPLIDPNSILVQERYDAIIDEQVKDYYIYETSIDSASSINLEEDISFTKRGTTDKQEDEVLALGKEEVESFDIDYNSSMLYLGVAKKQVDVEDDWRDLSFLVGRYAVVTMGAKVIEPNSYYYLISDFDMIKIPLTFTQKITITLISIILLILLILLIWLIIYKLIKHYRKERWYEYALNKAETYYSMHRSNMDMYGWTHKYSEYESLKQMTLPQLREYAKKMYLPIPYKMKKNDMVNMLSLLTEAEIERINDFTEYEIEISEKVRNELVEEFQLDKKENKWMKRRFKYTIHRAERMQEEDYKRTITDLFVDSYKWFDKMFIGFTDIILVSLNLKKKEKPPVVVEGHEWDEHDESMKMEEGIIEVSEVDQDIQDLQKELEVDISEINTEEDSNSDESAVEAEDDNSEDADEEKFDFNTLTKNEILDWLKENEVTAPSNLTKKELVQYADDFYHDKGQFAPDEEGGDSDD